MRNQRKIPRILIFVALLMQRPLKVRVSLNAQKELHLTKAQAYYDLKKKWISKAKSGEAVVVCFDFLQNFLASSSYKRQFSF